MVQSPAKNKSNVNGLTLIEVLIALVIIAIALTAIIKATTQNIRSTGYLQHKTLALWVAEDILNKVQVGNIKLTSETAGDNTVNILGEEWHWRGRSESTANARIQKVSVDVYASEDEESSPVISLESFIYAE